MTDERCKQLMKDLGLPNNRMLMQALYQVANETEQEVRASLAVDSSTLPIATALKVYREYALNKYGTDVNSPFTRWCEDRINEKEELNDVVVP